MSPLNMHLQVLEMLVASLLRASLPSSKQSQNIKTFSKSLHIGLLPSSGLVSLHSADLETIGRPQLRVPPTSDRVLLNGRSGTFSLHCICHPMFNIKDKSSEQSFPRKVAFYDNDKTRLISTKSVGLLSSSGGSKTRKRNSLQRTTPHLPSPRPGCLG